MTIPEQIAKELAVTITNLREVRMMYDDNNFAKLQKTIEGILSSRLQFWANEIKNEALDECISKSFKKNVQVAGENEVWDIVKKEEILKLKI